MCVDAAEVGCDESLGDSHGVGWWGVVCGKDFVEEDLEGFGLDEVDGLRLGRCWGCHDVLD